MLMLPDLATFVTALVTQLSITGLQEETDGVVAAERISRILKVR